MTEPQDPRPISLPSLAEQRHYERWYVGAGDVRVAGADQLTACADCGEPLVLLHDQRTLGKRALCPAHFAERLAAIRTAAARGFRIGL